ncbi:hypothetical protein ARC310_01300 [Pantoea ananatis]|uniref:hypothetical protein n=1 Tax=Pantoea ananas TaxID=553 RepID=UPI000DA69AB6|nr:hypothetical protein [Pantoea ananatis]PZD68768.1 hypothetical protein ARC310_01300 [Pantoea ananatis]PZD70106.1 hypothetical protein ARC311_00545 [Pantoea ananatis]
MTAAAAPASKPFTAIRHELADIEKINGKVFTMNMVYTYALIEGYQSNGQTAYFSQELLSRRLGLTDRSVRNLLRDMVAMGLINKTVQIGGKTCHYTVNLITPEMLGTSETAKPEVTKPTAAAQHEGTVENAGTNQPGTFECGHKGPDMDSKKPDRTVALDNSWTHVRGAANDTVSGDAANDDVRSNSPVLSPVSGNKVIMLNGQAIAYTEPDNIDFGDPF